MNADEKAMIGREVKRLGNQIAHKLKLIKAYQDELPRLRRRREELLARLADSLDDDGGPADG